MKCYYLLLNTTVGCSQRYGIAAVIDYDGVTVILDLFIDLGVCRKPVEKLVQLCNALDLDPMHLQDVVEDFVIMEDE